MRAHITGVGILRPLVSNGLWFGAMSPFALAALTMESAVKAASELEKERTERFPQIVVENAQLDYEKRNLISIKASFTNNFRTRTAGDT